MTQNEKRHSQQCLIAGGARSENAILLESMPVSYEFISSWILPHELLDVSFGQSIPADYLVASKTVHAMLNYAARVRESISKHGFHVTYVGSDETPSFCYSTGIFETFEIPELFLSALPPNLSHGLISQYVERHRDSRPPLGRRVPAIQERFDYYLIPVELDAVREYALASFEFYGDDSFDCLQLAYPDPDLHFPDEPGYNYDQVILGSFPP